MWMPYHLTLITRNTCHFSCIPNLKCIKTGDYVLPLLGRPQPHL
jgi:hypothetical protein